MIYVSGNSQDAQGIKNIIEERFRISNEYCVSKGWPTNPADLSFEQIMEIRALDSWKNAGKNNQ